MDDTLFGVKGVNQHKNPYYLLLQVMDDLKNDPPDTNKRQRFLDAAYDQSAFSEVASFLKNIGKLSKFSSDAKLIHS